MRNYLLIICILNFFLNGFSQNRYVDSVISQLSSVKPDTIRLKKLSTVTQEVMASNCDQAIILAKYGISESEKLKHTDLKLQFKSILGYSYKVKGDFNASVASFMDVLKEAESSGNLIRSASATNNLGTTFLEIGKYKEAEYYFLKAITTGYKRQDTLQLARTFANYGYLKAELQQHDSALIYYQKALPIFIKAHDSLRVADNYLNIGRSLLSLHQNEVATQNFLKALFIFKQFEDIDGECRTILNLADVEIANKNYKAALDYNFKALELAKANNSEYLIDFCYQGIADCYTFLGDYKNALDYFKRHKSLNDSINSLEKHQQIVDLQEKYQSNLKDKKILEDEIEINKKDKQRQTLLIILIATGCIISILAFLFYKLKQYNSKLEILIKEKEFLMHEVHHRVKNNLQLLGSLLELQIRSSDHEKTKLALLDSQNRVSSIATLHSKLYKQSNVISIQLNQYIIALCNDISKTFTDKLFKINYTLDAVEMNVDKSIVIGLIVNEIVTNSIKHAYDGITEPTLTIILKQDNNAIKLFISDNGKGIVGDVDVLSKKSLGLKVIKSLSKQIGAELIINNTLGLSYNINFNI
ncbi:MAG: tetratricopeptide repeat protein [Bacteroidota bacterium]|nr:tetratricopeptide repeat protein [Bacteroidota bacterium]